MNNLQLSNLPKEQDQGQTPRTGRNKLFQPLKDFGSEFNSWLNKEEKNKPLKGECRLFENQLVKIKSLQDELRKLKKDIPIQKQVSHHQPTLYIEYLKSKKELDSLNSYQQFCLSYYDKKPEHYSLYVNGFLVQHLKSKRASQLLEKSKFPMLNHLFLKR